MNPYIHTDLGQCSLSIPLPKLPCQIILKQIPETTFTYNKQCLKDVSLKNNNIIKCNNSYVTLYTNTIVRFPSLNFFFLTVVHFNLDSNKVHVLQSADIPFQYLLFPAGSWVRK